MPKCRECRGTGKDYHGNDFVERFYSDDCRGCDGHGWLPFWTEAERAGIKALGLEAKLYFRRKHFHIVFAGIALAIRAYVKSARAVKEGK